ncbi:hypothetical protein PHSY_002882 [Pseudozyma hubeiensis SY62]|uniref:Uncharacterized protein n=1 Tax=Pseudozyma hubeiensis (strain SY62) TaxID=1305764 RepID=R9P289_PSEHS|nr:hypothetical protein PHSY_002882 [Pseudozyma hubeiensis SY62]GAC95307.1 hypothetical protein PHSY_002882 [Pseudozyma hubeiensis SY62]
MVWLDERTLKGWSGRDQNVGLIGLLNGACYADAGWSSDGVGAMDTSKQKEECRWSEGQQSFAASSPAKGLLTFPNDVRYSLPFLSLSVARHKHRIRHGVAPRIEHIAGMPPSLTDNKDALVLRLKYHKTTLFIACQPTTPISTLKADFLSAIKSTNQPELSTLPQFSQPDGKSYPSWGQMDGEHDIGLFIASAAGSDDSMTVFMPLDQDTAQQSDLSVRKAGLKDSDAVCVGFRADGACKCTADTLQFNRSIYMSLTSAISHLTPLVVAASISQPIVQFTDVEEEEDEDAIDPDSVPPPLSD